MKKLFALAVGALVLMGAGCMGSASTTTPSGSASGSVSVPPVSGSGSVGGGY